MRESFVFHFEYLEDVPEEMQAQYAMCIINYARYKEEPTFEDWRDIRDWRRIKSRIDEDASKYERKCRNLKNYQQKNATRKEIDWQAEAVRETLENEREAMIEQYESKKVQEYSNESTEEEIEQHKKKSFEKPSIDEVNDYCTERKNGIDGQQFVDFYTSKGWKIGNAPMKDWKAAIRTWEKRQKNHTSPPVQGLPADRLTL